MFYEGFRPGLGSTIMRYRWSFGDINQRRIQPHRLIF